MEQPSAEAAAKAVAFANGLRRNVAAGGRRWAQLAGGASDLASVLACIDRIRERLERAPQAAEGGAEIAACIADLRAVLEWTAYQSANVATAQAIRFARKTRTFAERFGVFADDASGLSVLVDSEKPLIQSVRVRSGYMAALAARYPHLELPRPLVTTASLTPAEPKKPKGRLAFIQRIRKSIKEKN